MKTVLLCITFVFLTSCSADSDLGAAESLAGKIDGTETKIYNPSNPSNPFDLKGRRVYETLQLYYHKSKSPNSIPELAQQIRFTSEKLNTKGVQTKRLIPFTDEMVESIMEDPDNSMISIVQNSTLQVYAKDNLIGFLQHLIIKRQQEFSVTYNYITDYEQEVVNDTVFSSQEVETILTVASISRYSLYSAEERKDRDWETNVGGKSVSSFFEVNQAPIISIIALLSVII
ncbi:hypothetical protein J2Y38_002103 [Flavobacterium sp. 2755]|uniref:hypothetical protein n=1 Tax=Flavobacterium sp. 2755 TaxID=2817765 RepID=UPI0028566CE3|nr:hypothetical protein [Flavobacterium sp. 2755]MDR6761894.1 hypothetical protein [Flavobacterium sp. 2755]